MFASASAARFCVQYCEPFAFGRDADDAPSHEHPRRDEERTADEPGGGADDVAAVRHDDAVAP